MADATPPAYRIETTRAVLRCWEPADAPAQFAAIEESYDHLKPWLPWAQEPPSLDKQLAYLRSARAAFDADEDFAYGLFAPTGECIGSAGSHTRLGPGVREIGYWIHAAWGGKGLATEATAALTRAAFEIDRVDRVEIRVVPDNVRSARVAQKLGFRHQATLRRRAAIGEQRVDLMIWEMFADEYPGSVAAAAAASIVAFDALGRRLVEH